jgi:hypothetical protein
MQSRIALISLSLLLTGCSASREELSLQACANSAHESTQRSRAFNDTQKRSYRIDEAASRASLREVEPGVHELRLVATIDDADGKPSGQGVLCRTRFTEGRETPDVIAFTLLLGGD